MPSAHGWGFPWEMERRKRAIDEVARRRAREEGERLRRAGAARFQHGNAPASAERLEPGGSTSQRIAITPPGVSGWGAPRGAPATMGAIPPGYGAPAAELAPQRRSEQPAGRATDPSRIDPAVFARAHALLAATSQTIETATTLPPDARATRRALEPALNEWRALLRDADAAPVRSVGEAGDHEAVATSLLRYIAEGGAAAGQRVRDVLGRVYEALRNRAASYGVPTTDLGFNVLDRLRAGARALHQHITDLEALIAEHFYGGLGSGLGQGAGWGLAILAAAAVWFLAKAFK